MSLALKYESFVLLPEGSAAPALFCKNFLFKCKMHCGCIIYRHHAVAAVAFPMVVFLSKFAVVAVQNLVDQ